MNSTSSKTTLETQFLRLAVRTVHIREVGGLSPSAPTFPPYLIASASLLDIPARGGVE